jgi:hypothetical protein
MGILGRLFGRGKPPLDAFREDLNDLDVSAFLAKHGGDTERSRMLMVVDVVALLRTPCTAQERTAMGEALVGEIYIEATHGWAFTVGTLGTILSHSPDPETQKFIDQVFNCAENGLKRGKDRKREKDRNCDVSYVLAVLEFLRIARTGDFDAMVAYKEGFHDWLTGDFDAENRRQYILTRLKTRDSTPFWSRFFGRKTSSTDPLDTNCRKCRKAIGPGGLRGSVMMTGARALALMEERAVYACKSCGAPFCAGCMADLKKENRQCPACKMALGW